MPRKLPQMLPTNQPWTDGDYYVALNMLGTSPISAIATVLGRSRRSTINALRAVGALPR